VKTLLALVVLAGAAHAEDRPVRGLAVIGGSLLLSGRDGGPPNRADAEFDLEPGGSFGHFGGLVALRAFDAHHAGLLCAGVVFEAAAARPRIILDLHAELGADLDEHRPLVGGGLRTTVGLVGPFALALDSGAYLVIDGVDRTRLVISSGALVGFRW
jgi:hypothetical protein